MMPSSGSGQNDPAPAKVDTFSVWAEAYRDVRAENIILRRDLANARVDSVASMGHWETDRAALEFQMEILRDQLPRWYEKPGFVAVTVATITVIMLGLALEISFGGS